MFGGTEERKCYLWEYSLGKEKKYKFCFQHETDREIQFKINPVQLWVFWKGFVFEKL